MIRHRCPRRPSGRLDIKPTRTSSRVILHIDRHQSGIYAQGIIFFLFTHDFPKVNILYFVGDGRLYFIFFTKTKNKKYKTIMWTGDYLINYKGKFYHYFLYEFHKINFVPKFSISLFLSELFC